MQEHMKRWEAPHADQSQPRPLFFSSMHIHTPSHTINISCLVRNRAWGIPPPRWCIMFILPSCWSALCRKTVSAPPWRRTRPLSLLRTLAVYLKASHKFLRHWLSPLTPGGGHWGICCFIVCLVWGRGHPKLQEGILRIVWGGTGMRMCVCVKGEGVDVGRGGCRGNVWQMTDLWILS